MARRTTAPAGPATRRTAPPRSAPPAMTVFLQKHCNRNRNRFGPLREPTQSEFHAATSKPTPPRDVLVFGPVAARWPRWPRWLARWTVSALVKARLGPVAGEAGGAMRGNQCGSTTALSLFRRPPPHITPRTATPGEQGEHRTPAAPPSPRLAGLAALRPRPPHRPGRGGIRQCTGRTKPPSASALTTT